MQVNLIKLYLGKKHGGSTIILILSIVSGLIWFGIEIFSSGGLSVNAEVSKNNTILGNNNVIMQGQLPTKQDEINAELTQKNVNKIHSFFDNLNERDDFGTRNNIDKILSWKFTPEIVGDFASKVKDINIENTEPYGPINNDPHVIIQSFSVIINYKYKEQIFKDAIIIDVKLNPNNIQDHHLSGIKCLGNKEMFGPFCQIFGNA